MHAGQEYAPVFKLVCPDGTGGSREVCIENPFNVPRKIRTKVDGEFTTMVGHATIGAVNEEVKVANRIVKELGVSRLIQLCRDHCEGSPRSPEARREDGPYETGLLRRAVEPVSVCRALYAPIPEK